MPRTRARSHKLAALTPSSQDKPRRFTAPQGNWTSKACSGSETKSFPSQFRRPFTTLKILSLIISFIYFFLFLKSHFPSSFLNGWNVSVFTKEMSFFSYK